MMVVGERSGERYPAALALHFDAHDRMDLPERPAGLADLLGVLGIEQQPSAHAHERAVAHETMNVRERPFRMARADDGRGLDDDRAPAVLSRRCGEPEMPIAKLALGAVTVRRLGPFGFRGGEVSLDGY